MGKNTRKGRMNPVLRKLHLDNIDYTTTNDIRKLSKRFDIDYKNTIRNLMARDYLIRIFRGVFYVKSFDEVKMGQLKHSHYKLVSKGLEIIGVENWYFCLDTALKLNNITHEFMNIDYVATDILFKSKPIDIAGHLFRFHKVSPSLFGFGILKNQLGLRYSDAEKTILDIIYLKRYNGVPSKRIKLDIAEYLNKIDKGRIRGYLSNYPKSVKTTVENVL